MVGGLALKIGVAVQPLPQLYYFHGGVGFEAGACFRQVGR